MFSSNFCKSVLFSSKFSKLPEVLSTRLYGNLKVTVCGAAGHVGQPLCLLLKRSFYLDELCVYDVNDTCSFATELAHIDTKCTVSSYSGIDQIEPALKGSKIVVITAASSRTTALSYHSMFDPNARIIQQLVENVAIHCPAALLAIVTNPVNSLVPLASEILKDNGAYNPDAVFGVTTLNSVRANKFVSKLLGLQPECVFVPVLGGCANRTIIPLLSQTRPCNDFTHFELEDLTNRIQSAHSDLIKAKDKHAPTLCCAFSTARFVFSLLKGLRMKKKVIECAYVRSAVHPRIRYFATPLLLGPRGIQRNLGIPRDISEYEKCQIENAVTILQQDISKGMLFTG